MNIRPSESEAHQHVRDLLKNELKPIAKKVASNLLFAGRKVTIIPKGSQGASLNIGSNMTASGEDKTSLKFGAWDLFNMKNLTWEEFFTFIFNDDLSLEYEVEYQNEALAIQQAALTKKLKQLTKDSPIFYSTRSIQRIIDNNLPLTNLEITLILRTLNNFSKNNRDAQALVDSLTAFAKEAYPGLDAKLTRSNL